MTALARLTPTIDPREWIRASEAAERLGVDSSTVRRRCESDYAARGLATKHKAPGDRNEQWWVKRSIDPALEHRGEAPPEDAGDHVSALDVLMRQPAKRRAKAERKAKAVSMFREWRERGGCVSHEPEVIRDRIEAALGVRPSINSLYRWEKAAEHCASFTEAAVALLDGRVGGTEGGGVDPKLWRQFEARYLDKSKPSVAHVYLYIKALAEKKGLHWPSLRTIQQLKNKRISPERECMAREGEHAWQARYNVPVAQDPDRFAPGERWESDHTTMDCFVQRRVGDRITWARPELCVWFDWKTRCVVGWDLSYVADAESVRRAFVRAVGHPDWEPPRSVTLDNGRAFSNEQITGASRDKRLRGRGSFNGGLLGHAGVEVHFAEPGNHNGKARIERSFGMMHEHVCKESGAYAGARPGDVDDDYRKRLLKDPSKLPTLRDLELRLHQFFLWHNARTDHGYADLVDESGRKLSPWEVYQTGVQSRVPISDAALERLKRSYYGPLKVHKTGVGFRLDGRLVRYWSEEMRDLFGHEVYLSVGEDLSRALVCSIEGAELFVAPHVELHNGTDKAALRAARKRQREAKREAKKKVDYDALVYDEATLAFQEMQRRAADEATARLREQGTDVPKNLRFVPAIAEPESPTIESQERRLAAGGEDDPEAPLDLAELYSGEGSDEGDGAGDSALGVSLADLGDDDLDDFGDEDDDVDLTDFGGGGDDADDFDDLLGALGDD